MRSRTATLLASLGILAVSVAGLLLASCGGSGGDGRTGVVADLTGDSDAEVSKDLDRLVYRALLLDERDDPLDD